jgi:hypothetical protein
MAKWQPGQSANPAGRPRRGGLSIIEWCNELLREDGTEGRYSLADIYAVLQAPAGDKRPSMAKRLACRALAEAYEGKACRSGCIRESQGVTLVLGKLGGGAGRRSKWDMSA